MDDPLLTLKELLTFVIEALFEYSVEELKNICSAYL